jgi:hypothetical protein
MAPNHTVWPFGELSGVAAPGVLKQRQTTVNFDTVKL